ncbi:HAMP domain-containing sensor histidine kinase [Clostridiaceae bacterium M8S5]|nr:HAMP domain-containing sensor histidine kinase [Clostridiaceae bacterium M8S5]
MRRNKRILIIIFIPIAIFLIIIMLNFINTRMSNFVLAKYSEVRLDKLSNKLYLISNIEVENENEIVLKIKPQDNKNIFILINGLRYSHEIHINDKLVSQNINPLLNNYNKAIAYKAFKIHRDTEIKIKGNAVALTSIYIAKPRIMNMFIGLRAVTYSIVIFVLLFVVAVCVFMYINNMEMKHYLIFIFIGIVYIYKIVNLGEIYGLTGWLAYTSQKFYILNVTTNLISLGLVVIVLFYMYNIKTKKYTKIMLCVSFIILWLIGVNTDTKIQHYNIVLVTLCLISWAVLICKYVKQTNYCHFLYANNLIFISFIYYENLIEFKVFREGTVSFLIKISHLGAVLYLLGFMIIFIFNSYNKIKMCENQQKELEKVKMLRGISHDFKMPLSVIKLSYQMMFAYNMSQEERIHHKKICFEAISQIENMTDNIGSYLSLDKRIKKNNYAILNETLDKVQSRYKLIAIEKNIKLFIITDGKNCIVPIEDIQFERVLYNLVDNAFKYNKPNGHVKIESKINKKVIITVEDTGIGMKTTHKIFTPLYRIDESRSVEGIGLGLSIVKCIIEKGGGEIEVKSIENKGTKFTVILPKKNEI